MIRTSSKTAQSLFLQLAAAVAAVAALSACNLEGEMMQITTEGMPMENTLDAEMNGVVWDTPVQGAVDRSYGGLDSGFLWANLERQSDRGVMAYLSIFSTEGTELNAEPGVVYGSSTTSDDAPMLDAEGNQFFRTDDTDAIETVAPEGVSVDVGECDGPNVDAYEDDRAFENVAYTMEDCADCSDEGARNIRFMAWNDSDDRRVTGEFTVVEGAAIELNDNGEAPFAE